VIGWIIGPDSGRVTGKPEIIALSARLSGSESRVSTFDVHVANIIRASETRGAQFHSREHKQQIGHSAH